MADKKRKPISKKTRFEVFKRDKFTCQYCGRSAPDVVLELEHIVPVAEGGTNDIMNLCTSCMECNRGKGKVRLDDSQVIKLQREELEKLAAKREQLEMMFEWKKELLEFEEKEIQAIQDLIYSMTGSTLSKYGVQLIKKHINQFGFEMTYSATKRAFTFYYKPSPVDEKDIESFGMAVNKIGGICFNWTHHPNEKDGWNGNI